MVGLRDKNVLKTRKAREQALDAIFEQCRLCLSANEKVRKASLFNK